MEDFSSITIVDSAEIVKEFQDAGIKIAGEDVIDQLKKLSVEYNLTPADIYAQWLSYTNKKPGIEIVNSAVVEAIKAKVHQTRIKTTHQNSIKAKFVPKVKPRIEMDILATYVSISPSVKKEVTDVTKDDGDITMEKDFTPIKVKKEPLDEPMEAQVLESTEIREPFQVKMVKVEKPEYASESLKSTEATIEMKIDEDDHLFKKEVLCEFGRTLPSKAWISLKKERGLKISPFDHTRHLSSEEKFFDCNIEKCTEVMDSIFDQQRDEFIKSTENRDIKIGIFDEVEPGEATYFGRVRMDAKDDFDEKLVFIHEYRTTKNRFQLDLSRVREYSLFPGQSVEVCGDAITKNTIRVSEISDTPYLIRPFPKSPQLSHPLNIVTACGPFHTLNSDDFTPLNNLIDYCTKYRPDVLILFGPIIEMTPAMFDFFSLGLFNDALTTIVDKLSDSVTRIIVISSPKEWHTSPVFPTPPYNGFWDKIEFYPSPSLIDIDGLIIGASSVDIVLNLTQNLLESRGTSEPGNRIKRILRHILTQNSLYPLYPSADDVSFETPKMEYTRFTSTPHIIILPSMLRNFIHSIEGCIFVNPEKIRKNTIGRILVSPTRPSDTNSGPIESSIAAQIVKL